MPQDAQPGPLEETAALVKPCRTQPPKAIRRSAKVTRTCALLKADRDDMVWKLWLLGLTRSSQKTALIKRHAFLAVPQTFVFALRL